MAAQTQRLVRSKSPRPGVGIVHLGLGAFFRAHGALYINEAMSNSGGNWGIVGVSMRSASVRDALLPQDCTYTAVEQKPDGPDFCHVEVIQDVLFAPEDPERVLKLMADPQIRIVSMTITEKGYCHNPATGRLDFSHPDIQRDLSGTFPTSALGFLVRAAERRYAAGHQPFTVLSCDNLPQNGQLVRTLVLELANRLDQGLENWISQNMRFPSTMVDRIVPATTPADIATVREGTGYNDAAPVVHEPFRQWVIEDSFVGGSRPDLESAGVIMVEDVSPFEDMKLRCLNGTHSALAYLGYLAGFETIADTVANPAFNKFVRHLWHREIIPVLDPPSGIDLHAYAGQLLDRYTNRAIRHRTWQIAMDGSRKLPQRILVTLEDNLEAGRKTPGLMLALAAWMRYVGGIDETGHAIDVRDPLADRLRSISDSSARSELVSAMLEVREIFPEALAKKLEPGVATAYQQLVALGALGAVEKLVRAQDQSGQSSAF